MFNLKRKVQQLAQPKVDTNVLVAQIHSDFDTATERLLNEAKSILAKNIDTSKGEALRKLGFVSSKPSIDSAEDIRTKQESEQLAKHIEYYSTFYPNSKFITEKEVEKICKKYGLLCGNVGYYIGDVPDKNVTEISKFKLREEDCKKHACGWYKYEYISRGVLSRGFYLPCAENQGSYGWIKTSANWRRGDTLIRTDIKQKSEYEKPEFKICASVKDFDMNQMRVTDGYKLEQNIPDPIVLQPVNGGYLIVSKWGLEGQDESLVNEKLN
ncbi:MAG TPA: hypothetical protein PLX17_00440 [Chitinophagaceae bacterium]|nr:hypothetical protein [Chitinophagaceae bacterium]